METFLADIEQSAYATALRESFVVYPLVNAAHILSIGAVIAYVLLMDAKYLGWTREPAGVDRLLRSLVVVAFVVAVLTGLSLFAVQARQYGDNPAFRIKLLLILAAGLNLAIFSWLDRGGQPAARISALASMILWPAILVAGRFIGFV